MKVEFFLYLQELMLLLKTERVGLRRLQVFSALKAMWTAVTRENTQSEMETLNAHLIVKCNSDNEKARNSCEKYMALSCKNRNIIRRFFRP